MWLVLPFLSLPCSNSAYASNLKYYENDIDFFFVGEGTTGCRICLYFGSDLRQGDVQAVFQENRELSGA